MSWTIKDLLAIPLAEVVIEQPLEGTVKVALPVKTHEKYGQSQFLVIEDGTGEVAIDYKAAGAKAPLPPVEKGDRVRIQAQMYKNKLSGAKKEVYEKNGEKKAKVVVYGNRLTNLTGSAPSATASGPAAATLASHAARLSPGPTLTEPEALLLWERTYKQACTFALPSEAARCASTILSGALAGMLALQPRPSDGVARAPKTTPQSSDDDAPPYDDDDIPF